MASTTTILTASRPSASAASADRMRARRQRRRSAAKHFFRSGLLAAAFALLGHAAPTAAATTWNLAIPYPSQNFHTQNDRAFAADVARLTGGALKIEVNSDGTLANNASMIPSVASGAVPLGDMLMSYLSNQNPIYALDAMPFLATSYGQAHQLWLAQKPVVAKLLEKQGLMLLYAVPWPPQGIYTKRPVHSLADLKGLRIRSYNATLAELIKLSGGTPTEISVPQIPQAFSTGMVQAMITSPATGANSQAWDYVDYFYDVKAWIPKDMVIVNKAMFEALPKKVRDAVLEAAARAEKRGWEASTKIYAQKMAVLKAHGMHVEAPSPALKASLDRIGTKMLADWQAHAGSDGTAAVKAYLDQRNGN